MSSKNDKLVHNLSSKELTEEQMQVLRHEASFNTADAKPANMIAAVESILSQTGATDETKNLIRHQVSSLLMAHRPRDVLSKVERDALKELRADNDLVIVPADKGRSTVILDRTDYNQKAKSLFEDRQSYVPCESNPMKTLTREINATLLAMENAGAILPIDRRMARAQETALARFYGLPKAHKEGAPLRPIVSLKGTPTYGLAKWLFQRLKFLTSDSNTTVSSSTQFLEKLKGVSLLPSDIMVSFDVTSLFTFIPQDLAVETIELLLREKYDETENRLGHAQIIQLLKFCLKTYFTFDGTIYEQVKGTPMGSPISGLIAAAVLQRLESLVFRHHRPKFWARYVDDTFVVIERDQVLTFKEQLNAVFPDIQFTMEEEENNQLAFLDVLVCRKDCGGLKTKVFRKATNTTQILNFNSNHPISHKRSCVRALYRRVETHCSEMEDKVAELQYLRRLMRARRRKILLQMLKRPSIRGILHGYCCSDDTNVRPHARPLDPVYTTCGPDWSSQLRHIKPYQNESQKDERLWPDNTTHLRTYAEYYGQRNCPEWSFYSNNYHRGKRCIFAGHHTRSEYCHSVVMCLGQERRVLPNTSKEDGRKAPQTTNKTRFSTVSPKKRNVPPVGTALVLPKITTRTASPTDVRGLDTWTPSSSLATETAAITFPTKKT
nr:unnamed protein product [Spirometra erinaceieuropaei]